MDNIYILDTSLRDGGYINDWMFGEECIKDVISKLNIARVDIIECGFLQYGDSLDKTYYRTLKQCYSMLPCVINSDMNNISVMLNFTCRDKIDFTEEDNLNYKDYIWIRLAFFKSDYQLALMYAEELISLGYKICLQMMAIHEYTEYELIEIAKIVSGINYYGNIFRCLSIVDSFGIFYEKDINYYFELLDRHLNKDIIIGLHCHNNLSQATSNCISLINKNVSRNLIIDSSIFGMGRGAGNAHTEILCGYLNKLYGKERYNTELIEGLYCKYINGFGNIETWGYNYLYYLTAKYKCNPSYIWYLKQKNINNLFDIESVLIRIPDELKFNLDRIIIDSILEEMNI
ncbi:MAG: hypothetical protein ACM3O3_12745 [Syntrophothermus sp.]